MYGNLFALLGSLSFFKHYFEARASLFTEGESAHLIEGAVMTDFPSVLRFALIGFPFVAVCMLAFVIYHYSYFYQNGKSIYLMRRLPNKTELHKRAWTFPLLLAAATLFIAICLLLFYFAFYRIATPNLCLSPYGWQKMWGLLP